MKLVAKIKTKSRDGEETWHSFYSDDDIEAGSVVVDIRVLNLDLLPPVTIKPLAEAKD